MQLLIVGDLQGQIVTAAKIAQNNGATVSNCQSIEKALDYMRSGRGADVVMVDVKLDIESFIKSLHSEHIVVDVVGCGLENDSDRAVLAIKAGAKEYIPLPPDEELIAAVLAAIVDEKQIVVCESEKMKQIYSLANKIAPSSASVLISGESGTGKEVIARHIHQKSSAASRPMVCINCAAIPDNLLESELFGHEKGAFTGAVARRIGKFEEASNSTILLDEISEMDIRLQAKLLRVIQEKKIDRVGGSKPININSRIIATTNRDLQEEVKKGNFREDLYFRLNVINIKIPELVHRKDEIKHFVDSFIRRFCKMDGLENKKISREALLKLESYSWPGNVRELENAIHRAVLISGPQIIEVEDIILNDEDRVKVTSSDNFVGRTVDSVEKELILNTLDHCLGNRTHTANILGISIRTLRNKLKEYQQESEIVKADAVG